MGLSKYFPAYGGYGPICVRIGLALGSIATILIFLRIYVRVKINNCGTTALLWAVLSWILTTITQIFGVQANLHGLGNHITVLIEYNEIHNFLMFTWISVFLFNLSIPAGKASIAAFLLDVNGKAYPRIRWTLISIAAINIACGVPVAVYVWFQCDPPSALFDPQRQNQCSHHTLVKLAYFIGALATVSDVLFAVIPWYILRSLQIPRKIKWGISFLLGTGIFAAAAAAVRTWATRFLDADDPSYYIGTLFIWGEVEEWLLIICASVAPTWPLFKPYFQHFFEVVPRAATQLQRRNPTSSSGELTSVFHEPDDEIESPRNARRIIRTESKEQGWFELEEIT